MHLLIPFASALSEEASHVLATLALPNLSRLLGRLTPAVRDDADAYRLSPPHERALASLWGWQGSDGALPFAAATAADDGIDVGDHPWGLVSPAHWHVGRDQVSMADPQALGLAEGASRELFGAVRDLFESEGYAFAWGAPDRWYAAHPGLEGLPCASLDRVIGRNVDFWLGSTQHPRAALIRRLQSEVQLLLYTHPINEAREADGALAVNSFWLSGCGARQAAAPVDVEVDSSLRRPLLDGDWVGWAAAWKALDDGPIARLLQEFDGAAAPIALTLCGERSWQRFEPATRSWWTRLRGAGSAARVHEILESL